MSIILRSGTITSGVIDIFQVGDVHTGRFGLMLNGNFDSGHFDVLFGVPGNHQFPKIPGINPAGVFSTQNFTVNGLFYIEAFGEEIDIRIQSGGGAEDVDYVLFVGERP